MARTDFTTPRLCLDVDLSEGATATLSRDESNYLLNVLRLTRGAPVLAFNGRDGEFAATIDFITRKSPTLAIGRRIRGSRNIRPTSTICSRRSSMRGSITWRRRRSKWACAGCSRC